MSDEIETIDKNPKSWAAWKREAERLQAIIDDMALAAMASEPHTDDELSNLLWYSQEATCHSDPNYYCEFQRLATPGLIAGIIRELQERRKADSEPVAIIDQANLDYLRSGADADVWPPEREEMGDVFLYRHAQLAPASPVFTCPSGDGSLRWPCPAHPVNSQVIPDGWTGNDKANAALMMLDRIETVDPVDDDRIDGIKRIVRELAAGQHDTPALNPVQSVDSVADRWIPVSERIPDNTEPVLCIEKRADFGTYGQPFVCWHDGGGWVGKTNYRPIVTHWVPLPASPQEVK
ncbi:TPA: DUF551 domain-containing protein [Klebsiella pneumoniae]|uniref:DUF551 domain-containing protein n=1 Tax=Klebsiella pneumoniae TaxID=573 RepID=UPI0020CD7DFE|nr:DUF551 domain-containing protein [Klebsiella pneumoniae]MCQ0743888.1 DUF551 domain-containing protein [Klebsiella pneumoniae]